MSASSPPEDRDGALVSEQWPAASRNWEVVAIETFHRIAGSPRKSTRLRARKLCRHGCWIGTTPLICRTEVARLIGCHPDTLSRDTEELESEGLVGKKLGGSGKRWRLDSVLAYAKRKGLGTRAPGRPRKLG